MQKSKDSLGDRMKFYEKRYAPVFMPTVPVIARIDGRGFHTFTKGLARPYDQRLSQLFIDTTKFLVETTHARCGYTQSDEITLVWQADDYSTEIFFGAKLTKLTSVVCSLATAYFNRMLPVCLPEKDNDFAVFDNRVFEVPNASEAANVFVWREQDAVRNSVQMAARAFFSHTQCHKKNCKELLEMLAKANVKWDDYPRFFKRGTYVRKKELFRKLTKEEFDSLPLKHHGRKDPDMIVKRTVVMEDDIPPLTKIANRAEVILLGADPVLKE